MMLIRACRLSSALETLGVAQQFLHFIWGVIPTLLVQLVGGLRDFLEHEAADELVLRQLV